MHVRLHPPAANERGPKAVEAMLDAIHEANPKGLPLALEITGESGEIVMQADVPSGLKASFLEELQDAYPGVEVETLPLERRGGRRRTALLLLTPDVLPIRTIADFEDRRDQVRNDPLAGLLAQLRPAGGIAAKIRLELRPATSTRQRRAARAARHLSRWFPLDALRKTHYTICTSPLPRERLKAALLRLASRPRPSVPEPAQDKLNRHLFEARIEVSVIGTRHATTRFADRIDEVAGAFGRFTSGQVWFRTLQTCSCHKLRRRATSLMSAAELAALWHMPMTAADVSKLKRAGVREMEPPRHLPSPQRDGPSVTELGRVKYRGERRRFGIHTDDLRRHLFLCGRTGTGKSTLIRSMVGHAMQTGKSVCVIDPHGDLIDAVLDDVPKRRTNDVILFSAADRERPVAFNPLYCPSPDQRPLVAENVVVSLRKLYSDSWGPRLEQILRNSVLALLPQPDATLLSVQRLLTSKSYRASVVSRIADPVIRGFWTDVFGSWNDRFREEAVSPVLNKLDAFLANPIARAITCQPESTIRIREILDTPGSIFLCNLSKGLIGEQTSNVLGAFLVSAIQTAALARAELPEAQRVDVQIYIDEFHSFVSAGNSSFATILSESRKYRVSFAALATQFLEQIDEETLAAVFGNCGSTIVFRSGVRDAPLLAEHLGGALTAEDVSNLPNFTAYVKLLLNGEPTRNPFLMTTVPSPTSWGERRDIVTRVSRSKYGRDIAGLTVFPK